MRAARFHGISDVRVEDLPRPVCGPDDVLVRVAYAGICGSDLHVYAKGMFGIVPPMTMGHEFSGVVESVGKAVTAVRPGDHVVGDPRLGCGRCEWCLRGEYHLCAELAFIGEAMPGSYADYVVLPQAHLVAVPASMDLRLAALVEPMAVAVHALSLVAQPGQKAAGIVGAGPVGLLTLIASSGRGWEVCVADRIESRRRLAAELGAARTVDDVDQAGERWADIVFEAAGKPTALAGGLRWLRPGGRMALIGIYEEPVTFDPTEIVVKEAHLTGVSAYGRRDLEEAVVVLQRQEEEAVRLISDVLPLERAKAGLEISRAGRAYGKVLLDCA